MHLCLICVSLRTMLAVQMVRALFFLFFRHSRGDSMASLWGILVFRRAPGGKQESYKWEAWVFAACYQRS